MTDIRLKSQKSNIKIEDSIILFVFIRLFIFLQIFSPVGHLCKLLKVKTPVIITDIWLLLILAFQIIVLSFWNGFSNQFHSAIFIIVIYFLLDSLNASMRELVIVPNIEKDNSIGTYNRQRWLVASLIAAIEVVLSFSIIILYYGDNFYKVINDSVTAIYVSSVTFLTLGYGDYVPIKEPAKIIVIAELFYFLLFLAFKLPMAVSMIKIRPEIDKGKSTE